MNNQGPEIKIDETNISEELARQAGHFIYIAECAVKAEAVYETSKFSLDQKIATIDCQIRERAVDDGKKITEKQIEKEVELHPGYKEAKIKTIKAKAEKEMWRARREAWYQRSGLLVQMAINQRSELDGLVSGRVKAA